MRKKLVMVPEVKLIFALTNCRYMHSFVKILKTYSILICFKSQI